MLQSTTRERLRIPILRWISWYHACVQHFLEEHQQEMFDILIDHIAHSRDQTLAYTQTEAERATTLYSAAQPPSSGQVEMTSATAANG